MHEVATETTRKGIPGLLNKISRTMAFVAGGFTVLLMMVIVADVAMRRVFARPISGALEITEALLPMAVFLAFAYTEATGGNVRVTMLTERFSPRMQVVMDVLVYVLGVVSFVLLTWKTFEFAAASLDIREVSPGMVPFPIYPTKFAISLGCFLITLEFVAGTVSRAARLIAWKREG